MGIILCNAFSKNDNKTKIQNERSAIYWTGGKFYTLPLSERDTYPEINGLLTCTHLGRWTHARYVILLYYATLHTSHATSRTTFAIDPTQEKRKVGEVPIRGE